MINVTDLFPQINCNWQKYHSITIKFVLQRFLPLVCTYYIDLHNKYQYSLYSSNGFAMLTQINAVNFTCVCQKYQQLQRFAKCIYDNDNSLTLQIYFICFNNFKINILLQAYSLIVHKCDTAFFVQVKESDIHINQTAALLYSKYELYPPRLDFETSLDPYCSESTQLTCTIRITGFQCTDLIRNELISFTITAEPIQLKSPSLRYQRTSSLINQYSSLTYQQKQTIVDRQVFLELSKHIINWKTVGQHLGLEDAVLYNISVRDPSPGKYEYQYQVLLEWERHKELTTCADIAKALIEAEEMEALDFLIQYINNSSSNQQDSNQKLCIEYLVQDSGTATIDD